MPHLFVPYSANKATHNEESWPDYDDGHSEEEMEPREFQRTFFLLRDQLRLAQPHLRSVRILFRRLQPTMNQEVMWGIAYHERVDCLAALDQLQLA